MSYASSRARVRSNAASAPSRGRQRTSASCMSYVPVGSPAGGDVGFTFSHLMQASGPGGRTANTIRMRSQS